LAAVQHANNPNRILYPMKRKGKRGGGEWERIGWEEAIATIVDKIKVTQKESGLSSVGIWQGTGRGYNKYTLRKNSTGGGSF